MNRRSGGGAAVRWIKARRCAGRPIGESGMRRAVPFSSPPCAESGTGERHHLHTVPPPCGVGSPSRVHHAPCCEALVRAIDLGRSHAVKVWVAVTELRHGCADLPQENPLRGAADSCADGSEKAMFPPCGETASAARRRRNGSGGIAAGRRILAHREKRATGQEQELPAGPRKGGRGRRAFPGGGPALSPECSAHTSRRVQQRGHRSSPCAASARRISRSPGVSSRSTRNRKPHRTEYGPFRGTPVKVVSVSAAAPSRRTLSAGGGGVACLRRRSPDRGGTGVFRGVRAPRCRRRR